MSSKTTWQNLNDIGLHTPYIQALNSAGVIPNLALNNLLKVGILGMPDKSAMSAKGNRTELEKVINHYKVLNDSNKLEAAYFLIGNMADKYSLYYGYDETTYDIFYEELNQGKSKDFIKQKLDSISPQIYNNPLIVYDMDIITAEYLIKNIDLAFEVWNKPWAKRFSFEQFCEYILPYRIQTEPLSNWRQELYNKFIWIGDTLKNTSNTTEITLYLNDTISLDYSNEYADILNVPLVPVSLIAKVKADTPR